MYVFIIKYLREQKNMTQQELADKVNISRNYLSEIENNKTNNVSFDLILKISDVLNEEISKIYVADSDVEPLRDLLHFYIEKYRYRSRKDARNKSFNR